jgi:hypothetical protein
MIASIEAASAPIVSLSISRQPHIYTEEVIEQPPSRAFACLGTDVRH